MRIFISHGMDKADAMDVAFVDELSTLLAVTDADGPGHDVLLDMKRIEPGWVWSNVLHEWLAECQAAILLLSKRALTRDWVLKESTILAFRKARDSTFPLYPILLGEVTPAAVEKERFAPLCLTALQLTKDAKTPGLIARLVKHQLAALGTPPRTPLDLLERALRNWIKDADPGDLNEICEALRGGPVAWGPEESRSAQRAGEIARAIVRGDLGSVATLPGLLKRLRDAGLNAESRRSVLNYASPLWVPTEAVARLAEAVAYNLKPRDPPQARSMTVAMNGELIGFSPRMYAWRALLPDPSDFVYWIEGGGSDLWADELVKRMRRAYHKRHPHIPDGPAVDDVLANITQPVFFVLPPPVPDQALLDALCARYPRVTFIAHTGAAMPDEDELPLGALALLPTLDRDVEIKQSGEYNSALAALG